MNTKDKAKIVTGDVIFCTGNKVLAKAIMKVTQSKYSHVAIFYYQNETLMVADSQANGFNGKTYENWVKDFNYTFDVRRSILLTPKEIEENILFLLGTTPYDFESFIFRYPKMLIRKFFNKFRKNKKEEWKDRGTEEDLRMYCSESVASSIGITFSERMSPEDLLIYADKHEFPHIYSSKQKK